MSRRRNRPRRDEPSRAGVTSEDLLAAVPQRNESAEFNEAGTGMVVTVPLRRPRWLVPPLSWMIPFSGQRRVQLDALGRAVVELCDGRRNVEEIVESFRQVHTLTFREAQLAVTAFLRELMRRGIVVLVGR